MNESLNFEIKELNEETGEFSGYASTYGNVDSYGDRIEAGAFSRTVKSADGKFPLLWQHDWKAPIGVAEVVDDNKRGLKIRGELNLKVGQAREALELLRQKAIKGLSIGFESIKEAFEGTVRVLSEIKLWEVSVVTFPANDRATVTVVKAVVPFQDLPLADRDREWSARTAERRVRAWADAEDGLDTAAKREKYRQAFVWYDSEDAENFGAYKLPIADVLDGRLTAVPRAIFAAAAAIEGARGGVDIPEADAAKVRTHLGRYYSKMDLTAPWDAERQAANAVAAAIGWATLGVRIDPAMAQSAIDALAPLAQEGKEGQADPGAALSDWLPPAPPGAGESDERQKQAILDAVAQYTAATGN